MSFTITFNAWWIALALFILPVPVELFLSPREYGFGAGFRGVVIIGVCWLIALGVVIGKLLS